MAAATRFFSKAIKQHGAPRVITLDGYAASHRALAKLKHAGMLRWSSDRLTRRTNPLRS